MCVVFYTLSQPGHRLILAANRDEFMDRPAAPAGWHNFDSPQEEKWALSGRDLGSPDKGTWLGMTSDLRVGILTNIRSSTTPPDAPSRGRLLKSFLAPPPSDAIPIASYLRDIDPDRYVGFNLLLFQLRKNSAGWDETEVGYLSNRPQATTSHPQEQNCRGMSNSPMKDPYPKVVDGEKEMTTTLAEWAQNGEGDNELIERMMAVLTPAPPIQSVNDLAKAMRVTPFLIGGNIESTDNPTGQKRWYGTRVSTVIIVKDSGEVIFVERDIAVLNDGRPTAGHDERKVCFHV